MKEGINLDLKNILEVKNRCQFREWLRNNYDKEQECWIYCKRGKPIDDTHFWYLDAVEEALCFGWIDSTIKTTEHGVAQRFTPRKSGKWSELNKERCRRLEKLGLMTEAGKRVLPDMSLDSFRMDKEIVKRLKANDNLWKNFLLLPPLYQRVRINTIQIAKKNKELYENRLDKFIENTAKGKLYGDWNDYGRLLDY